MKDKNMLRRLLTGALLASVLGLSSCNVNVGVGMNMGVPSSWGSGFDQTVGTTSWGGRPGN
jgi:hypothetical protein